MAGFHRVAGVSEVGEGEMKAFFVGTEAIAVCRVGGEFYAFRDECTHQSFTLSDGDLEGGRVACRYHGAEFDIKTGRALCLPATEALETYPVRVEGDDILVGLDD